MQCKLSNYTEQKVTLSSLNGFHKIGEGNGKLSDSKNIVISVAPLKVSLNRNLVYDLIETNFLICIEI